MECAPENEVAYGKSSSDQIFLAGLLHDIGYMALSYLDRETSDALCTQFQELDYRPVLAIEHEMLCMTHCDIGAKLGLHWDLPEEIIAVIRYHHTPDEEGSAEGQPLVSMINIAEKILPEFCIMKHEVEEVTAQ